MLEPHILESADSALEHHDSTIRGELARLVSNPGKPTALDDVRWKLAKLPIRNGGLGLQDLPLVAPAQFAAAMGSVYQWATTCAEDLKHKPAEKMLR